MRRVFSRKNNFGLPEEDLKAIEVLRDAFYTRGLDIHYEITPGSAGSFPTYADLMVATDGAGIARSFLATEENFAISFVRNSSTCEMRFDWEQTRASVTVQEGKP